MAGTPPRDTPTYQVFSQGGAKGKLAAAGAPVEFRPATTTMTSNLPPHWILKNVALYNNKIDSIVRGVCEEQGVEYVWLGKVRTMPGRTGSARAAASAWPCISSLSFARWSGPCLLFPSPCSCLRQDTIPSSLLARTPFLFVQSKQERPVQVAAKPKKPAVVKTEEPAEYIIIDNEDGDAKDALDDYKGANDDDVVDEDMPELEELEEDIVQQRQVPVRRAPAPAPPAQPQAAVARGRMPPAAKTSAPAAAKVNADDVEDDEQQKPRGRKAPAPLAGPSSPAPATKRARGSRST